MSIEQIKKEIKALDKQFKEATDLNEKIEITNKKSELYYHLSRLERINKGWDNARVKQSWNNNKI